jgi:hypothetical protein
MENEIITRLKMIRHRQEKRLVVASMARGLLAGSIAALALGAMAAATLWLPLPAMPGRFWVLAVLSCLAGAALVAGVALGVARRPRLPAGLVPVAELVDAQCRLQDRLRTALEFLEKADRNPVEELQIAEAAGHLSRVDPAEIAGAASNRPFLAAVVLSLAAGGLIAWGWLGPANRSIARAALGPVSPGGHAGIAAAGTNGIAGRQVANPVPQPETRLAGEPPLAPRDPHWGPAPAAHLAPARASLGAGPTLEEILAEAAQAGTAGSVPAVSAEAAAAAPADQGELLPLEYRPLLRQYFESIRPKQEPFNTGAGP